MNNSDLDIFSQSTLPQTDFEAVAKPWGLRRTDRETFVGGRVLEYRDSVRGTDLSLDLYVGNLIFSHEVPVKERIVVDWPTLPLAELLATKLQVHQSQMKDVTDIIMLLGEHELGDVDDETINVPIVVQMCERDWGLWVEAQANLDRARSQVEDITALPADIRARTRERIEELSVRLANITGSFRWRIRSLAGTKVKYWNDVQEWRQ